MRILVVGAGLGGLLANALLRRKGHDTVLVDHAADFSRGGYVLALWRLGMRPLECLGLAPAITEAGRVVESYAIADRQGVPIRTMSLGRLNAKHGPLVQLHRTRLHQILCGLPENRDVRMSTTVARLDPDRGGVTVGFTSGASDRFDVVIGADGIRSVVRRLALPAEPPPVPFRARGWAFMAPADERTPEGIVELWASGKYVGVYRFSADRCGVYCAIRDDKITAPEPPFQTPSPPAGSDEKRLDLLRGAFSEFGGYIPKLFANLPPAAAVFHDTLSEIKISSIVTDRVALLGDSAHAMLPFGGMGASMAFEDAAVLAEELPVPANGHGAAEASVLKASLRRYEKRRRWRVRSVQFNAWLKGLAMLRTESIPLRWRSTVAVAPDPLFQYGSYQERVLDMLLASTP